MKPKRKPQGIRGMNSQLLNEKSSINFNNLQNSQKFYEAIY